jgi:hypothetical protein
MRWPDAIAASPRKDLVTAWRALATPAALALHSLEAMTHAPRRRIRFLAALALGLLLAAPGPAQAADELEQYQQRLQQLFRQLDRNGDGTLDPEEVRANAYLRRHFDRLDRGGKDYLVPADLR